jgi:hypothetical protein
VAAHTAAIETAAMGFSPHSGWAAMVVLGGSSAAPTLLARSRVILINEQDPKSKQPYHAVESMNTEAAATRLEEYMAVSVRLALASIQSESEKLKGLGLRLRAVGILDSSGRKHVGTHSRAPPSSTADSDEGQGRLGERIKRRLRCSRGRCSRTARSVFGRTDGRGERRLEIGLCGPQALQLILGPHVLESAVDQDRGAIRVVFDDIQ